MNVTADVTAMTTLTSLRCTRNRREHNNVVLQYQCRGFGGPAQEGLVAHFGFEASTGQLVTAMKCPPGTPLEPLQRSAAVFTFVASVLAKPTRASSSSHTEP